MGRFSLLSRKGWTKLKGLFSRVEEEESIELTVTASRPVVNDHSPLAPRYDDPPPGEAVPSPPPVVSDLGHQDDPPLLLLNDPDEPPRDEAVTSSDPPSSEPDPLPPSDHRDDPPLEEKLIHSPPTASKPDPPPSLGPQDDSPRNGQPSSLSSLPVELLLHITTFLDPVSSACLALTNRGAYWHLSETYLTFLRAGRSRSRSTYLRLLEKDPVFGRHLWYCHVCRSLHPFGAHWSPLRVREEPWAWHQNMYLGQDYVRRRHRAWRFPAVLHRDRAEIWYHHARLVMNRHLHGPACGLPLSILSIDVPAHTVKPHVAVEHSTRARIIRGGLYLKRTVTIFPERASTMWEQFWPHLFMSIIRICHHTEIQQPPARRDNGGKVIPESVPLPDPPCPETSTAFTAHHVEDTTDISEDGPEFHAESCRHCPTDFVIRRIYHPAAFDTPPTPPRDYPRGINVPLMNGFQQSQPARRGWYIVCHSYHQLGACRDAEAPAYRGLFDEKHRGYRTVIHPYGRVRRRWLAAEVSA